MSEKPNENDVICTMFAGKNSVGYNTLMTALNLLALERETDVYNYLEVTPKTSLVVEIYDKLLDYGYEIVPRKE